MISLFKDIFEYHHHFNQKLILEIKNNFSQLPERTFPLFCHVLNAHQIWNARILHVATFGVQQLHDLEACGNIDDQNYSNTLQLLNTIDLKTVTSYKNSKSQEFSNTVRDILFHVANHTTHHRGQIISDFRQKGISPIVTDYIFFKR